MSSNAIQIVRGDTATIAATVTRSGSAVDLRLASTTVRFTAVPRNGTTITKTTSSGITIPGTSPGDVALITISPSDTTALTQNTQYTYDIEVTEPDGTVSTVAISTFTVITDIST